MRITNLRGAVVVAGTPVVATTQYG